LGEYTADDFEMAGSTSKATKHNARLKKADALIAELNKEA